MTTTEFNEADLPELPNNAGYPFPRWVNIALRDYGRHCVAAYRKKLMEQPAVAYRSSEQYSPDVGLWFEYYDEYREINDTSGLTPLYAAPMPQANESEAVKALRKLVQAHDETDLSRFKTVGEHADYLNSLWDAARAVLAGEPGAKDEQPSIDCLACAVRNAQLEQTPNSEVTAEYLDWLRTDCRSEGVGGNEAWNAGVAWARANSTAEQPKQAQAMPDDFIKSVKHLCFQARTSGGTAGRDAGLCAALDRVEAMLMAIDDPDWQAQAGGNAAQEPLVRFCPGCGSVGPVEGKYRDCCPDGNEARMIPAPLAEKCRDTFKIAVKSILADAATNEDFQPQASRKHCPQPTECFDHAKGRLCDHCLGKPQASGKAAPSDADIIHIAARTVPAFTNRDALTFASALLERYGNSGSICAVEIKDGK